MAAAARAKREAREAAERASPEAGPSSSGAAMGEDADEVEIVGARSREERDAELRQQAVDVDVYSCSVDDDDEA